MNKIKDNEINEVHESSLEQMREHGGKWYAYRNEDMCHSQLGHIQFLKVGVGCTYEKPPKHYPDTQFGLGWRYRLYGKIDLERGVIE